MSGLRGESRTAALPNGDLGIALRHGVEWIVGFRLHQPTPHSAWNVAEFSVKRTGRMATMNGNDIRELPLGDLMARARRLASDASAHRKSDLKKSPLVRPSAARMRPFLERGATRTERDYAALALEYVLLVRDGSRRPSEELAVKYDGSAGTWTNRIVEARRLGLLTPVKRGEAGGALTSKAEKLLAGSN